jgi:hypothetical protein
MGKEAGLEEGIGLGWGRMHSRLGGSVPIA